MSVDQTIIFEGRPYTKASAEHWHTDYQEHYKFLETKLDNADRVEATSIKHEMDLTLGSISKFYNLISRFN